MAQATAEMILAEIAALPADEREKLRTLLNQQSSAVNGQAAANDFIQPSIPMTPRRRYVGWPNIARNSRANTSRWTAIVCWRTALTRNP